MLSCATLLSEEDVAPERDLAPTTSGAARNAFTINNEDSMRTRACALALLVTLSPAMFPIGSAFADDALTEMARQRFQEGVKFFDQKKYEEARAAFLQAYALKRHPAVLLNLAQSELRANRPAEAARHFAQYLRENPNPSSLERQDAERGLVEARAKAGRVSISVNAAGADVFIDDEFVGKAPLPEPVDVSVGAHRIEAKLGEQTATASITASAGKIVDANLVLGAGAPAATPAPTAPAPAYGPGPGTAPAYAPPPGQYPHIPPPPSDSGVYVSTQGRQPLLTWVRQEPVAWATLGVTAVGLGLGTFGLISAASAGNKADDLTIQIQQRWTLDPEAKAARPGGNVCLTPALITSGSNFEAACGKLQSTLDDEQSAKNLAWVGIGVAAAGVAATTVAYFVMSKKSEAPTAIVAPVYGPDHAGLSLTGSF